MYCSALPLAYTSKPPREEPDFIGLKGDLGANIFKKLSGDYHV
jgi:hypothetical protein